MSTAITRGLSRILENRRYEDYKSMKQAFKYSGIKEIVFEGFQTLTNSAANLEPSDIAVSLLTPAATVFLFTIADDGDQQGQIVYTVYQDNTGLVSKVIATTLDDVDSSVAVPLGSTSGQYTDVVNGVAGQVLTMTALDMDTDEEYVDLTGWYIIGMTDNNIGTALPIASNTKADPTLITLEGAGDRDNWAADIISIQQFAYGDFYRVRELYSAVEVNDTKTVAIGNQAESAWYGVISRENNYMATPRFFTQPGTVCRSFLGRIKVTSSTESTDAKKQGNEIQVTFNPKASHSVAGDSDIIISLVFDDKLDWQPCIELEPATDVSIQILALDATNVDDMHVEVTYLEVYDVNKQKT